MKKFNIEKELKKIQSKKGNSFIDKNYRKLVYVIVLLVSLVVGINSSNSLKQTDGIHNIKINIENGYQSVYVKTITGSTFSDVIDSNYKTAYITCNGGDFGYNVEKRMVYITKIDQDLTCNLVFNSDDKKAQIDISSLNEIADNDGISYYFKKDSVNNYVRINYMLFRIVRINGDGSFRLVLDSTLDDVTFGESDYLNSNVYGVLNEWFNNNLNNINYIVEKDFDTHEYDSYGNGIRSDLINFDGYSINKVGLLSVNEIMNINDGNKVSKNSYLYGKYFTMNVNENGGAWAVKDDGVVGNVSKNEALGVKPVINVLVSSLKGSGTVEDPYIINEE